MSPGSGGVFYAFDPQGSTTQRLDSSANVLNTSAFDAFGSGKAADPYAYGAVWGYYSDQETGLNLLGYRYYASAVGQFLTRDPIGYYGGVNVYSYVQGNPQAFSDPLGLVGGEFACPFGGLLNPICDVGLITDVVTALGLAIAATQGYLHPARTADDERQAQEAHDIYKSVCRDLEPPPSLNDCESLSWHIERLKLCVVLRKQWDLKWGSPNDGHADQIAQKQREINNLLKANRRLNCPN